MTNNPAGISIPEVAQGQPVGAIHGYSAEDCVGSGRLYDITEFGASTSAADNSAAIEKAMKESASDGGAAYIPEGEFRVQGWRGVHVTADLNGATLVGDGIGSRITASENCIFFEGDTGPYADVEIANLRLTDAQRGINCTTGGNEEDNQGIVIQNIWCDNHSNAGIRMDFNATVIRHCSAWGSGEWHGIAGWNVAPHNEPRSRVERSLVWDNNGYGIDMSEGSWIVDGCLTTQNGAPGFSGGAKMAPEKRYGSTEVHSTWRNCVFIDNPQHGFRTTGDDVGARVEFDNCLFKDNGGAGLVVSNGFRCKVGTEEPIYVINNGNNGLWAYDGAEITGGTAYVCGNNSTTHGNVNLSNLYTSGCDAPLPGEIIEGGAGKN